MDVTSSSLISKFRIEFIARLVSVLAGSILSILLARLLSPDGYGLLYLAISALAIFQVMAKLGIAKSTAKYISEYRELNPKQIYYIVGFGLFLTTFMATIASSILIFSSSLISSTLDEPRLETFLTWGTLFVLFSVYVNFSRVVLQGFEKIKLSAIIKIIDRGGRVIFSVGLVLVGFGAFGAFAGYVFAYLIAGVCGVFFIYKLVKEYPKGIFEANLKNRIFKYAIPLTATDTADVLDKHIDTVLVGFFLTPVAVSYYVLGKQIVEAVESPVSALGFTISPTLGARKASGDLDQAAGLYQKALTHALYFYVPASFGLIVTSDLLIKMVFGSDYLGAVPILQIFGIYLLLRSVTKATSSGLDYLGKAKIRSIVKAITSLLNVVMNIILIPTIGVVGAAIATIITYFIYTSFTLSIMIKQLHIDIRYLAENVLYITLISLVMSAVVILMRPIVEGILSLLFVVLSGVLIWGVLCAAIGLIDFKAILFDYYK